MVAMAEATARRSGTPSRAAPLVAGLAAVGLSTACSVSPKPEPPITVPKPPTLDESQVSWRTLDPGGKTVIVGRAGAVDPPEGFVRAYDLSSTAAAVDAPVTAEGGFEVALSVEAGDAVRLEVIGLVASSGPSDLVVAEAGAALEPLASPLGDCLAIEPGLLFWVEPSADGLVRVQDTCGLGIELAAPRPRTESDRLEVGAEMAWPLALERGVPVSLTVRVLGGEPGDEYLFFIEATAPEPERRAVSVRLED